MIAIWDKWMLVEASFFIQNNEPVHKKEIFAISHGDYLGKPRCIENIGK